MAIFTPVKRPPQLAGYGGLSLHHPANSLASLRAAQMLGVEHIALDVQACADGHLICYNECCVTLNNKKYEVKNLSLSDLSKIDLGSGQRILTLNDVLTFLREDIYLTVRVQEHYTLPYLKDFLKTHSFRRSAPTFLASTDQLMLQSLSDCAMYAKLALATKCFSYQSLYQIKNQGAHAIVLPENAITDLHAFEAARIGLELWACGINCIDSYRRCIMRDVRVIVSQDPFFVYDFQLRS